MGKYDFETDIWSDPYSVQGYPIGFEKTFWEDPELMSFFEEDASKIRREKWKTTPGRCSPGEWNCTDRMVDDDGVKGEW